MEYNDNSYDDIYTDSDSEAAYEYDTDSAEYDPENMTDLDGLYNEPDDSEAAADSESSPEDETAATVDGLCTDCGCKCELNDYEIISDVLGSEKQLVSLYSTALCESSEQSLRDVVRNNLIECAKDQYATFEYMEKRGMYPTEQAPEGKITEARSQFGPLA